jgi:hypothetical protein
MLLETYSGPATIEQPGGIEVPVLCEYRVEQRVSQGVQGLVRWRGSYASPEPVSRLDRNLDAVLLLPDGRRGSIFITNVFSVFSSYEGIERGEFTGAGRPPT